MNYRLAYFLGFHPWEDAAEDPPFAQRLESLFEAEESMRSAPFGKALDLGTGSGIWGIELSKRGWTVTGVDIIEHALDRARERVRAAGVKMTIARADVTQLPTSGIGTGFHLVLDTGTFHGLNPAQRIAMGEGVTDVAAQDASLLMLVWPKRRRPLIRGASRGEIEAAFPAWQITAVEPSHFRMPKPLQWLMRPDEHWYRLRRLAA